MPKHTPNNTESWRPVVGYEGLYEVSSHGRVKSLARKRNTGRGIRTVRERILRAKPGLYPTVTLRHCGDPKTHYVHDLVLRAFIGPPPSGFEACHGDGDKWNCRLTNLRWDTPSGNHRDRVRHGVSNRGERSGTAKLSRAQVEEIKQRCAQGERQSAVAREFGVSQSLISQIVNERKWGYGQGA